MISSIAALGMTQASRQLGASAHNVANVGTDGFVAARSGVATSAGPAPLVLRDGALVAGSGTDLVAETVNQVAALATYRANAATFRAGEGMTEALLDIVA